MILNMNKESLFGKTLDELKIVVRELGIQPYAAGQIAGWLYKKNVASIDDMTNLSKDTRRLLAQKYILGITPFRDVKISGDGTKKYLFPALKDKFVETAYIPEKNRDTLCLSTQVGCKMACLFCMTGKQGFQGNLTAGEIINQLRSIPEHEKITNLVYMGMGEPFDNLQEVLKSLDILTSDWGYGMSAGRITVSTIGLIPAMREFLIKSRCNLAISLHSPFEKERRQLMPVENVYPLNKVIEELKSYDIGRQRRISFEYIMFKDLNDTQRHVKELASLLNGLRCRINLIKFHPVPNVPLLSSDRETMEQFKDELNKKGIFTTIRQSRGEDISAACGMLSTRALVKEAEKDF
jgi:23S rRNA (adenine2503-C2)-methyltransferase